MKSAFPRRPSKITQAFPLGSSPIALDIACDLDHGGPNNFSRAEGVLCVAESGLRSRSSIAPPNQRRRAPVYLRMNWFAARSLRHLYSWFVLRPLIESGAAIFHAQTHFPTQPAETLEKARLPNSDEDEERSSSAVAPSRQGSQAGFCEARLSRIAGCSVLGGDSHSTGIGF